MSSCNRCNNEYSTKENLKRHIKECHQDSILIPQAIFCNICQLKFRKNCQLRLHLVTTHGVPSYSCALCEKSFIHLGHLNRHKKIHDGYMCNFDNCDKVCDSWTQLRFHKSVAHKKVHSCQYCGTVFPTLTRLKRHTRVDHPSEDGVKMFKCTYENCDRVYIDKRNLTSHVRVCHELQFFRCPDCFKTFSTKQKLSLHTPLHDPSVIKELQKIPKNSKSKH